MATFQSGQKLFAADLNGLSSLNELDRQELSSDNTIDFTAISQDHTNLYVVVSGNITTGVSFASTWLRFNSDSNNNYTSLVHSVDAAGTLTPAGAQPGNNGKYGFMGPVRGNTAWILIANYTDSTLFTGYSSGGFGSQTESNVRTYTGGGIHEVAAAVTSVTLNVDEGALYQSGTVAILYGIV